MTPLLARSVETGRVVSVDPASGGITEASGDPGDLWVGPGLVDIQVNGFAGVDYNEPGVSGEEIARSAEVIRSTGVTRFLPTVITGSSERMTGALRSLAAARERIPSISGFHVEGPWISAEDGPRGAHPREHVRPADRDQFLRLQDAAGGGIRLLTLAPESPGALSLIEFAAGQGITVAIGHTGATGPQIRDAIRAGASLSTHLGNGCHSVLPRHPNYIWEQMASDELYASLIADGIHLPASFVKCAVRAKGLDKTILTTDATACATCPPGRYLLGGMDVDLARDNSVRLAGTGLLAGSALRMDRGVENFLRFADLSLKDAWRLAAGNPARALGLSTAADDLVLFRFDPAGPRITVQ